jgi:hypothetical protein
MSGHGDEEKTLPVTLDVEKTGSDDHSLVPEEPFSGQFLDSGEAASKARNMYIKILLQRTLLILIAVFAIFPIYWGALWRIPARSLEGWIIVRVPC